MKLKNTISLILCFVMIVALISCGNTGNGNATTTPSDTSLTVETTGSEPVTTEVDTSGETSQTGDKDIPDGMSVYTLNEDLYPNDIFYAIIRLGEGSGLCGARFDIKYNGTLIEPVLEDEGYLDYSIVEEENVAALSVTRYDIDTLRIVYVGKQNITAGGKLLRVLFQVKPEAQSGDSVISLEKVDDFYSKDYTELNLPLTDRKIRISN